MGPWIPGQESYHPVVAASEVVAAEEKRQVRLGRHEDTDGAEDASLPAPSESCKSFQQEGDSIPAAKHKFQRISTVISV